MIKYLSFFVDIFLIMTYFVIMFSLQANTLLIADPFLKEEPFRRSVIYLCEHNEEGSFGLVLNKKFDFSLSELIVGVERNNLDVYVGGPVGTDTLHFLHQYPQYIPGSKQMSEKIFWGGNFEKAIELINHQAIDVQKIKFFIGYSGWSPKQLDNELNEKSWIVAPSNAEVIFNYHEDAIWEKSIDLLDQNFQPLKNYPLDPQLN